MTAIRSSPSGVSLNVEAPLAEYGLQSAWFIDPANGNDDDAGTADFPIASVPELNARLSGVTIEQATTVDVLGDVPDGLALSLTRMGENGSLTVRGTKTTRVAGIAISTVTAVGPGSTYPWQVVTTGIDWTTVVATYGALPLRVDFSNGNIGWVSEIVNATTVVLSTVGSRTAFATPVAGQTFDLVTFSRMPPPRMMLFPVLLQSSVLVELTDLTITAGGFIQFLSGPSSRFYGCQILLSAATTLFSNCVFALRLCGVLTSGFNVISGTNTFQLVGGVVLGNNSNTGFLIRRGHMTITSGYFHGASVLASDTGYIRSQTLHIRATLNPITINTGGRFLNTNAVLAGSNNTGVGITVANGAGFTYLAGANGKPTLTGASDTLIGVTARTYAQIPYVDLQLDAIPPTVTTLVGGGAYMVNE